MNKRSFLILSGGTGGHVIPAVNFGNFIIDKGFNCILFVDKRGKKYTSSFNGNIKIINSSHLSNNFFGNIKGLFLLLIGFFQSLNYLIKIKPKVCISFGGYATFTPLLILIFFRFLGITKIFLHEQNSKIGKVNILFSFFANKVFLNFDIQNKIFSKYKQKKHIVGLPYNNKVKFYKRNLKINNDNKIILFISGGSQGAFSLNENLIHLFCKLPKETIRRIKIIIQCPEIQKNQIIKSLDKLSIKYEIKEFFNDFIEKLYKSDILISRSGAGTVNDVILTQIPTIFVPLPSSAENHQFYNAEYLAQKKASIIIEQKDLKSEKSLLTLKNLINDSNQKSKLIKNLQQIKIFDTNKEIFEKMYD